MLPLIVLAQLMGTSTWFAANAVMPDLQRAFAWDASAIGTLSSALQAGFIVGTLVFALLTLADRFPARRVFFVCALAASACTLLAVAWAESVWALVACRALTGFFLAGIYPVGMKIAAQWFPRGLGAALGWLVAHWWWAAPVRTACGPRARPGPGTTSSSAWRAPWRWPACW